VHAVVVKLYVNKPGRRNGDISERRHSLVLDGIHPDDFAAVWTKRGMHIFAYG
jgi:hypothetical protein